MYYFLRPMSSMPVCTCFSGLHKPSDDEEEKSRNRMCHRRFLGIVSGAFCTIFPKSDLAQFMSKTEVWRNFDAHRAKTMEKILPLMGKP